MRRFPAPKREFLGLHLIAFGLALFTGCGVDHESQAKMMVQDAQAAYRLECVWPQKLLRRFGLSALVQRIAVAAGPKRRSIVLLGFTGKKERLLVYKEGQLLEISEKTELFPALQSLGRQGLLAGCEELRVLGPRLVVCGMLPPTRVPLESGDPRLREAIRLREEGRWTPRRPACGLAIYLASDLETALVRQADLDIDYVLWARDLLCLASQTCIPLEIRTSPGRQAENLLFERVRGRVVMADSSPFTWLAYSSDLRLRVLPAQNGPGGVVAPRERSWEITLGSVPMRSSRAPLYVAKILDVDPVYGRYIVFSDPNRGDFVLDFISREVRWVGPPGCSPIFLDLSLAADPTLAQLN